MATASGERHAPLGEVKICYETFGAEDSPPLLLVMGLGSQMLLWEEEFCELLADRQFRVIRFDNRDAGRSTILREAPPPSRLQLLLRDARAAAYTLDDMADDAAGLLDHLGVRAAHVVGASMGGMIAQLLAIRHPDRVLSLVSIMSTTGDRRVGRTHPLLLPRFLRKTPLDRDGYVRDFLDSYSAIGSRGLGEDTERRRSLAERCHGRGIHPAGSARQLAAILASPDRTPRLKGIDVPTLVIHGDADRLVGPSGGRATAAAIPGARLELIPGMGHDLPRALWEEIIDAIVRNAACAQPVGR